MTSGRFTPAAATLINTSPGPGTGIGRSARRSTSGPPNRLISTTRIDQNSCCRQMCSLQRFLTTALVLLQPAWQPRRRQRRKLSPLLTRRLVASRAPLNVRTHEVFAQVVVDDVTTILVEKLDALLGPRVRHHRVLLQPVNGGRGVNLPVQVAPRGFV